MSDYAKGQLCICTYVHIFLVGISRFIHHIRQFSKREATNVTCCTVRYAAQIIVIVKVLIAVIIYIFVLYIVALFFKFSFILFTLGDTLSQVDIVNDCVVDIFIDKIVLYSAESAI